MKVEEKYQTNITLVCKIYELLVNNLHKREVTD